jgi:alpha-beta hydrolase superfamily lysophospholipase
MPAPALHSAPAPLEERITGADHLPILLRSWRPEVPARAVVAICHGFNSHSGYYRWTAQQLVARGFAVYAVDLHGRGESDGERFYTDSIEDYVADVDAMVATARSREPGLPVFLLGHSAGGVTATVFALDRQAVLAGLICESFAFQVPAPDVALALLKGLSHVAPHLHVLRLKNEDFSRDPEVVAAMNADPLIKDEVQPTQTVAALVRADERLKREFGRITLPVLILHGTADRATSPAGSSAFHQAAGSTDKTLKLYDGHVHDLLNDTGKERVLADIGAWIEQRLS